MVGGYTHTNDNLLRTHMYDSNKNIYNMAYTEPLKNYPFAIPLTYDYLRDEINIPSF